MKVGSLVKIVKVNPGEEQNLNKNGIVVDVLSMTNEAVVHTTFEHEVDSQWIYSFNELEVISE